MWPYHYRMPCFSTFARRFSEVITHVMVGISMSCQCMYILPKVVSLYRKRLLFYQSNKNQFFRIILHNVANNPLCLVAINRYKPVLFGDLYQLVNSVHKFLKGNKIISEWDNLSLWLLWE